MRNLILIFAVFVLISSASAATNINTPTVSGHWTLSNAPYLIFNDIKVDPCDALTIDPGVEVIFQGYYSLTVYGSLKAEGTATNYISFHVNDTTGWNAISDTPGAWQGISYAPYGCATADPSLLKYCDISDVKSWYMLAGTRTSKIEFCNFHHARAMIGPDLATNAFSINFALELSHCKFYDITMQGDPVLVLWGQYTSLSTNIHDCEIHDIHGNFIGMGGDTAIFQRNNVYNNYATPVGITAKVAVVSDNKIHDNTDPEVAALCIYNSDIVVERNYICNNYSINGYATDTECGASQGGGGIRISGPLDAVSKTAIIRNNVIANNNSGFGGGGVYIINGNANITNNQFVNNSGARGTAITFNNYPSTVHGRSVIKNNLFYHNVALGYANNGSGLYPAYFDTLDLFIGYADTVVFERNWVSKPIRQAMGLDAMAGYIGLQYVIDGDTSNNIVGTDPGLIAPTHTISITESALSANFGILASSPCINKGTTSGILPGNADYINNTRIYGTAIDIGAYEYGSHALWTAPEHEAYVGRMNAYPNPANGKLFVFVPETNGVLQLIDVTGRLIKSCEINDPLTSLDISNLSAGTYEILWMSNYGKKEVQKVIIK